ncbi:MAG: hypothetical protein JWN76_2601 [Chitinophagaceae bacterium]|nr:hypothetical protein [Chitinophagaceae bacterium]
MKWAQNQTIPGNDFKIKMKKLIFTFLINLLALSSFSQGVAQTITRDQNQPFNLGLLDGTVIKRTAFTEEGSTSLPVNNCIVIIKTANGKVYDHVNGRIDLLTNRLIFTINGQDLIFVSPIQQIFFDSCYDAALSGAIFKSGYPSINKQNSGSLYQVLTDGKATLLKYYSVQWHDDKPFNTNNTTRIYKTTEQYYLYLNGQMFILEKNKRNLSKLLSIPADYISKQKLNLKKEENVIKLVAYYNLL